MQSDSWAAERNHTLGPHTSVACRMWRAQCAATVERRHTYGDRRAKQRWVAEDRRRLCRAVV
eukprot:13491047-Alexandrium_andersonii.AAC.1